MGMGCARVVGALVDEWIFGKHHVRFILCHWHYRRVIIDAFACDV